MQYSNRIDLKMNEIMIYMLDYIAVISSTLPSLVIKTIALDPSSFKKANSKF
jgi:hypothetical protein